MTAAETPGPETGGRIVRPYTMTGGRTGAEHGPVIALEALVSSTPTGLRMRRRLRWEYGEIVGICRQETAIIELAALLEVPIGVVRVLVSDLRQRGAVIITDPPSETTDGDTEGYKDLLRKVLDGIQSI